MPANSISRKLLLTADPLVNSNDCTVVAILGEDGELAFIRLGRGASWIRIEGDHCIAFDEVLHCNNRFYTTNFSGNPVVKLILLDQVPSISKRCIL